MDYKTIKQIRMYEYEKDSLQEDNTELGNG